MLYTPLTVRAMQIAYQAHQGQFDHGNVPYIFHPYHLAEQMEDEYSVCAALLHDVVEDTAITLEQLAREFPEPVTEAVRLLTHLEGVDYLEYVAAIKTNPIATAVKLADLRHNSDRSRLITSFADEAKIRYFEEKYSKALALLSCEE